MSAGAIPIAALKSYGVTVTVAEPLAMASRLVESSILPLLTPHPRRRRRTWRTIASAIARWIAAVSVVGVGIALEALVVVVAARPQWPRTLGVAGRRSA